MRWKFWKADPPPEKPAATWPPAKGRFRAYVAMASPNGRREYTRREFCWINWTRNEDGDFTYVPDRKVTLTMTGLRKPFPKVGVVTWFAKPRGRKVLMKLRTEYRVWNEDTVVVQ
jgi:hypothetical protein